MLSDYRPESHVIYQGIPADRWWREMDRRQRRAKRTAIARGILIAFIGVGFAFLVVAGLWWNSL